MCLERRFVEPGWRGFALLRNHTAQQAYGNYNSENYSNHVNLSSVLSFYESHRFGACSRVGTEAAEHCRRHRLRVSLSHSAQRHARMFGFDDNHHAKGLEALEQGVCDIRGQPLLKL